MIALSITVVSMLPPASAARSTVTDPAFMEWTMSFVIMSGALRPGIKAVVTMMSTSAACSANLKRRCTRVNKGVHAHI